MTSFVMSNKRNQINVSIYVYLTEKKNIYICTSTYLQCTTYKKQKKKICLMFPKLIYKITAIQD